MQHPPTLPGRSDIPFPPPEPILYRPNVAAILQKSSGEIFIAERLTVENAWQFPQGGVDDGESAETALYRELQEEIGVKADLVRVIKQSSGYRYAFPKGRLKYGIYGGQEQTYFLCEYLGTDADIQLEQEQREFSQFRWILPAEFSSAWVPKFKRATYEAVFRDFFNVSLL
jgi:putative (di)nucleoside polyphosphate hydrolase